MEAITDLTQLLASMSPELMADEYVFCSVAGEYKDFVHLQPIAAFYEQEGLSLVINKSQAQQAMIAFDSSFKMITLTVHSSLEAVGLTAAVANKLTDYGISANVIAAYHHDHIFVPTDKAHLAMQALAELSA